MWLQGAGGIQTRDFPVSGRALYSLSYSPS